MAEYNIILTIALLILLYGYISKLLARFYISGPMIFTCLGILVSPIGLGLSQVDINTEFVTVMVEIALVLILFSDAALLDLKLLRQSWQLPTRLLAIGLPITILFGTLVAQMMFPEEPAIYMFLLALLLTPTDAALGKAVVSDPIVPKNIRSTINVESGLNDGIIFPIVITVLALILSGYTEATKGEANWLGYVLQQIGFGTLIGVIIGFIGTKLILLSSNKNWIVSNYQNLIPIALAILSYFLAEEFHGNGFIAAFFAGLLAGNTSQQSREHIEDFAESEGELLVLISFFVFGVAFVPKVIDEVTMPIVIYALLSLTVLRMLPVMVSLIGAKLVGKQETRNIDLSTMAFVAWFGPRGVASILYVLIVAHKVESATINIPALDTVYATVMVTVLMSIFAHGISAQPLANWYSKKQG